MKQSPAKPWPALPAKGIRRRTHKELRSAMPQPGSAGTLCGEQHQKRSQSLRPTLPCPPSAAAAGLGAAGNSLTQRLTHPQLEMQKGHVLSSGSAEHGHSYQQRWLESTTRAGASCPQPQRGRRQEMESRRTCHSPPGSGQLRGAGATAQSQINVPASDCAGRVCRWSATDITAWCARRCSHLEIHS